MTRPPRMAEILGQIALGGALALVVLMVASVCVGWGR